MTDENKGLNMIVGIALLSAIGNWAFGAARAREPLPDWRRRAGEDYPVGGPGPGGVGVITEPGIVSYNGLTAPVQPVGWHEELIAERVAAGLPHEALIEKYGIPPPPVMPYYPEPPGGRVDPTTPGYQRIIARKYKKEIAELEAHRAVTREKLGLREYKPPLMPREARGRR